MEEENLVSSGRWQRQRGTNHPSALSEGHLIPFITGAPLRTHRLLKAPPSRAPPPRAPPLQIKVILLLILDFRKVHVQTVVLPTQVFLEFRSRLLPRSVKLPGSRCSSVAFLSSRGEEKGSLVFTSGRRLWKHRCSFSCFPLKKLSYSLRCSSQLGMTLNFWLPRPWFLGTGVAGVCRCCTRGFFPLSTCWGLQWTACWMTKCLSGMPRLGTM